MSNPVTDEYALDDEGKQALGELLSFKEGADSGESLNEMAHDWDLLNETCLSIIEGHAADEGPMRTFVVSFLTDTYGFFSPTDANRAGGAACQLGALYYTGELDEGHEPDYAKAVEWYENGSRMGNVQALINLGYCYQYGRSVKRDASQAYDCFLRAALISSAPEAYYKLGDMYRYGHGIQKDERIAGTLYEKALVAMREQDEDCDATMPEIAGSIYHRLADMRMMHMYPSLLAYGQEEANGTDDSDRTYEEELFGERLKILELYQAAERCYRLAILNGYGYYAKNLNGVLAKQDELRELLN